MQGNSLISEFLGINFDVDEEKPLGHFMFKDEISPLIKQFQKRKIDFLNEPDKTKKEQLKEEIENLIIEIFQEKLKEQKNEYFSKLKSIEEKYSALPNEERRNRYIAEEKDKLYKKTAFNLEQVENQLKEYTSGRKTRPFFPWRLYFAEVFYEKGGFDVVIGNPPYQGFRDMDKKIKVLLQENYVTTKGKFDLYIPFIEKSYQILRKDGFFIFICPTAFTKREHGKHLRKFLLSNVSLNELVDFGHSQIFDYATNYTGRFSFVKNNKRGQFIYRKGFSKNNLILTQANLSDQAWIFTDEISKALIDKIKKIIY